MEYVRCRIGCTNQVERGLFETTLYTHLNQYLG